MHVQDELINKEMVIVMQGVKLTGKALKHVIAKALLDASKINSRFKMEPKGKMSLKSLVGKGDGVQNIEITNNNIGDFNRVARKYGIDYSVKRDSSVDPPKYLVFFKAKDTDALTAAFQEYAGKTVKKEKRRASVLEKLETIKKSLSQTAPKLSKKKVLER